MTQVSIRPQWTIRQADGQSLPPRLLELLSQVHATGSLSSACAPLGLSYRHAWDLVRQGEAQFGTALLSMARGKGSKLTPLGEKLVWADHRIAARLGPVLDSLASELALEIDRVLPSAGTVVLRLHASHGFAVEKLVEFLSREQVVVDRKYCSSTEAAAALPDGACDVAGFHLPEGPLLPQLLAHYRRWLDPDQHQVVDLAMRRQGLMVAPGNPKKLYDAADLARPGVRFINRQSGSGTRLLLEALLEQQGVQPADIGGFEQGEFTHAAVAAHVASGMADAGFGLETPARHFKLDFLPLVRERYFLVCSRETLASAPLQTALGLMRSAAFREAVNALPGYDASAAGTVRPLREAFGVDLFQ
jgi:molybdate transport repressor ModE-like protein